MSDHRQDITQLLAAMKDGDDNASEKLLPLVYEELRGLARQKMARMAAGQTLQPTALVHEAYMRLIDSAASWDMRAHFFGAAARAMRNILVEQARRRGRIKRGGDRQRMPLDEGPVLVEPELDMVALDEALDRLEVIDKRKSEIVMLRFFAGLSIEDTAAALGVSRATADRSWSYARAWLRREVTKGDSQTSL